MSIRVRRLLVVGVALAVVSGAQRDSDHFVEDYACTLPQPLSLISEVRSTSISITTKSPPPWRSSPTASTTAAPFPTATTRPSTGAGRLGRTRAILPVEYRGRRGAHRSWLRHPDTRHPHPRAGALGERRPLTFAAATPPRPPTAPAGPARPAGGRSLQASQANSRSVGSADTMPTSLGRVQLIAVSAGESASRRSTPVAKSVPIGNPATTWSAPAARWAKAIIDDHDGLRERELRKMERLVDAIAEAFRYRGVNESTAAVVAETAVGVVKVALRRWAGSTNQEPLHTIMSDSLTAIGDAFDQFHFPLSPAGGAVPNEQAVTTPPPSSEARARWVPRRTLPGELSGAETRYRRRGSCSSWSAR